MVFVHGEVAITDADDGGLVDGYQGHDSTNYLLEVVPVPIVPINPVVPTYC